jgi:predicted nicotinamide N-methyase
MTPWFGTKTPLGARVNDDEKRAPAREHDDALLRALLIHAVWRTPPLVPELALFAVDDPVPLWSAIETALGGPIDSPYFAVPWPGAQALARLLLDGRIPVQGLSVIDLGCGSGLAALAAKRAGARHVRAVDIDPLAISATRLAAERHGLVIEAEIADAFSISFDDVDIVLIGDLASRAVHAPRLNDLYRRADTSGAILVVADSGRPFFEAPDLPHFAQFDVPVPMALEGTDVRTVRVYAHELADTRKLADEGPA